VGIEVGSIDGVLEGSDVEDLPDGRRLENVESGTIVEGDNFADMVAISLVVDGLCDGLMVPSKFCSSI
jgi:hypothetical protein